MTTLGEITLRLQKLYSRKFGMSDIVHIIQESKKVRHSTHTHTHTHTHPHTHPHTHAHTHTHTYTHPHTHQVNASELDPEQAYIQITHVEPYFTTEDLERRKTAFERANNISRFMFETPFTKDGRARGDVTKQCMRKTILTSKCWEGGWCLEGGQCWEGTVE